MSEQFENFWKFHNPDNMDVHVVKLINHLGAENKKLRGVIESALRISDLWTLGEVETMFAVEAQALETMKANFKQALK